MPANTDAQPGVLVDPYRAYNFKIVIKNVTEAHFTYCSGPGIDVEVITHAEGGIRSIVRQIPGRVRYKPVTLRYGLTSSKDFFTWMLAGVQGRVDRQNVSILQLDPEGAAEVMRWDLQAAWPFRWSGAALDALQSEIAIETLLITYEGLSRTP